MRYAVSIDWLSIHCHYLPPADSPEKVWEPVESAGGDMFGAYPWRYKKAEYGTRQFSQLTFVAIPNPEGGWDDFAEIQSAPYSGILNHASVIVRFVNRALYMPDFWELADRLLSDNNFQFMGVTRIDVCADFNQFETIDPRALIEGFAAKKLRHVGRGVGALYFNHGVLADEVTGTRDYAVKYTGLSFGTHSSDAHVYLYNKSFELLTQGDKPWIRDIWTNIGLDVRHVWRLEVSLRSKGCKFKEKATGNKREISTTDAKSAQTLCDIYLAFVKQLFSFIRLPMRQKNISREPRIVLFSDKPTFDRGTLRNISAGNRMDRMIIKALYQLGDLYRGAANIDTADLAQSFAVNIAESTDLTEWMSRKVTEWERPTHK